MNQFTDYLVEHDLISLDQFAFLRFHSTQKCLHRIIDDWLEAMNEQELFAVTFLHIQKCFDTIDHEILIYTQQTPSILTTLVCG